MASNLADFGALLEVGGKVEPKPRFVQASSSSACGLNTKVPVAEICRVVNPVENEMIAHAYEFMKGLPVGGVRFFTECRPWLRP